MDQLPRLGKRELICLLLFTCNYVVFVWKGFLFLWVLGMGYVILLWHSLSLPYNYFKLASNRISLSPLVFNMENRNLHNIFINLYYLIICIIMKTCDLEVIILDLGSVTLRRKPLWTQAIMVRAPAWQLFVSFL